MEAKKIICGSCNATFDASMTACPYCGTMNYQGAEAEYMGDLEGIRQNLQSVADVPRDSVAKEFRKVGLRTALITLIAFGLMMLAMVPMWATNYSYDSSARDKYLWEQQHFEVMDQMLADGQYDELMTYIDEVNTDSSSSYVYSLYSWEHYAFTIYYNDLYRIYSIRSREQEGEELDEYDLEDLYYYSREILGAPYYYMMTPEVLEFVDLYYYGVWTDFQSRWGYTDAQMQEILEQLEKDDGICNWEDAINEMQSLRG